MLKQCSAPLQYTDFVQHSKRFDLFCQYSILDENGVNTFLLPPHSQRLSNAADLITQV